MTPADEATVVFRRATASDLPALVALLANDPLGATRETLSDPLPDAYRLAFAAIDADPNNELVVVTLAGSIAGMLQMTYIPYLTHRGSWRALIEGVRVHADFRSKGIGAALFRWAIARARERGCRILQLTSDKQRRDAIRFYLSLGFVASHEGFKMELAE